ncbi:FecR family protein [Mucilaginibacter pineti]|uniref:FecR family protein n=1 Tax=Mucilaginibacter pineti TaxID=1391627 RepID=A0A1G7KSL1_9SPHI|nr:FecR family protein [Mucilaginibacter pineti]SDF40165.1 FecR family protein [Mucilaginibacter pineti]
MQKQEFLQLVDKYLKGQASDREEQLLLNFFDSFQSDEDWDKAVSGTKQQLEDKMLQRLQHAVRQSNSQQHRGVFNLFTFRNIAAAAITFAIIGTAAFYGLKQRAVKPLTAANKPVVKHDVNPGKNAAILTLDNGEQVVLDSAKIGTLAKKGKISIKKTKDGQVIYTADKGAAPAGAQISYNTISTPRGGQYQVILPDGTRVWLNAASSLKFPTAFVGNQRNVELNGEAYFEVAKNAAKPFNVKVNAMNVKVLGTHFNIMAYNDEDAMKTTLLEGSVQLINGALSNYLKPGEQGVVKGNNVKVMSVDADKAIAWKNGFFEFDRSSIEDIMKQLSRWYDTEVTYEGKMPDDEFVGKIERSVKLSQVLHVLELNHVHFKIENKKITVTP